MSTAPGATFAVEVLQEDFIFGRELFQEPTVVHRFHIVFRCVVVVQPGGAHVAKGLMVTVGFTVGTNAYQLGFFTVFVPGALDLVAECACVTEQVFKANGRRKPGVVEEYVQIAFAYQVAFLIAGVDAVGTGGVNIGIAATGPFAFLGGSVCSQGAEGICLSGGENGELDACLNEGHNRFEVDGSFGKPHGFGHTTEMELKVLNAPFNLSLLVLFGSKRHDNVVVYLGDGVAVTQTFNATLVGFLNTLVGIGSVGTDPAHESGTHVETHEIVVVDDIYDAAVGGKNTACGVRAIALTCNAVVPVVERTGAGLVFNDTGPGVFTRRLIKVAVNCKIQRMFFSHNYTKCFFER